MQTKTKKKLLVGGLAGLVIVVSLLAYQTGAVEYLQGRFGRSTYNKAEIIKLLVLDTGVPVVSSTSKCSFSDIDGTEWYASYFYTACEEEWISFYGTTEVDPNGSWNKAELSKIAYNAYELTESLPSSPSYSDVSEDDWFYSYIETLAGNSAFKRLSGAFYPYETPSRSFVDYMLSRL